MKPHVKSGQRPINVLPDFFGPDDLKVRALVISGLQRQNVPLNQNQIKPELSELGSDVVAELQPTEARNKRGSGASPSDSPEVQ